MATPTSEHRVSKRRPGEWRHAALDLLRPALSMALKTSSTAARAGFGIVIVAILPPSTFAEFLSVLTIVLVISRLFFLGLEIELALIARDDPRLSCTIWNSARVIWLICIPAGGAACFITHSMLLSAAFCVLVSLFGAIFIGVHRGRSHWNVDINQNLPGLIYIGAILLLPVRDVADLLLVWAGTYVLCQMGILLVNWNAFSRISGVPVLHMLWNRKIPILENGAFRSAMTLAARMPVLYLQWTGHPSDRMAITIAVGEAFLRIIMAPTEVFFSKSMGFVVPRRSWILAGVSFFIFAALAEVAALSLKWSFRLPATIDIMPGVFWFFSCFSVALMLSHLGWIRGHRGRWYLLFTIPLLLFELFGLSILGITQWFLIAGLAVLAFGTAAYIQAAKRACR